MVVFSPQSSIVCKSYLNFSNIFTRLNFTIEMINVCNFEVLRVSIHEVHLK